MDCKEGDFGRRVRPYFSAALCVSVIVYSVVDRVLKHYLHNKENTDDDDLEALACVQEIPLTGVEGRLDHFAVDHARKLLYLSALGADKVLVIDMFRGRLVGEIVGLSQPQGLVYVVECDRLFVANAGDGHVHAYDGERHTLMGRAHVGDDPDNLRYDHTTKRVVVGFGEEGAAGLATIDPASITTSSSVSALKAHPEGFQLAVNGSCVFTNIADERCVQVIDRLSSSCSNTSTWVLPSGLEKNFPLSLVEQAAGGEQGVVLVGVRRPARLLVLSMTDGRVIDSLRCAADADDILVDVRRCRVYVPGGAGVISVFRYDIARGEVRFTSLGVVASSVGARTGVWVESRDLAYIACPQTACAGACLRVFAPR